MTPNKKYTYYARSYYELVLFSFFAYYFVGFGMLRSTQPLEFDYEVKRVDVIS